MAYINKIQIDNRNEYLIEPTLYTITEGTPSAYIADIPDFELVLGVSIKIRAHVNNAERATLNINNLGLLMLKLGHLLINVLVILIVLCHYNVLTRLLKHSNLL